MENAGVAVGVLGALADGLNPGGESGGDLQRFGFGARCPADPVEVLNHIGYMQRVQ